MVGDAGDYWWSCCSSLMIVVVGSLFGDENAVGADGGGAIAQIRGEGRDKYRAGRVNRDRMVGAIELEDEAWRRMVAVIVSLAFDTQDIAGTLPYRQGHTHGFEYGW